ncbi:YbaB/EbfC family nucleoid-associated protein [Micromonospora sp. NPDC049048]|uniref:YbaB/EbfC family nucleoid-associated protein n=1 Tax=Micromonospora sp. NPDC049048 TaxID=3364263 RepID=UPI00371C0A4E
MSATRDEVEALRDTADRLRAQVERATGSFRRISEEFGLLEATAVSADRLVTAVVGADGRLRRLMIDPGIYHQPDAEHLARTIEETIEVAAQGVQERVREILRQHVPEELVDAHLSRDADSLVTGFADLIRER